MHSIYPIRIVKFLPLFIIILIFSDCRAVLRDIDFLRKLAYPPEMFMSGLGKNTTGQSVSHRTYGLLLQKYVRESGRVAYGALKKNDEPMLDSYLKQLSSVSFSELSRYEQLALLINAYNAFTLKLIL